MNTSHSGVADSPSNDTVGQQQDDVEDDGEGHHAQAVQAHAGRAQVELPLRRRSPGKALVAVHAIRLAS